MIAILKRELRSCFCSPVGYVCVAAVTALYGFFYYQVMTTGSSSYVTAVYSMMFTFDMMIIPILTMRSMAEEKRNHTDQALLTAPVDIWKIVMGKFFACFAVFGAASVMGLLPAVAMSGFASPPWKLIGGNFAGTLCYGGAMISIGIFLSGLTVSQVIAAISTFAVSMFLMYVDAIAAAVPNGFLAALIHNISFYSRYAELTRGTFSIPAIVYFLGITGFFLFLTCVKVESARNGQWRWKSLYAGKCVLSLALMVLCNVVAAGLVSRFPSLNPDMTKQRLNSLSDEAKEVILGIDREIEVYVIADEEDARGDGLYAGYGIQYSQAVNLLEKMEELNPGISVSFKKPSANPAFISQYAREGLTEGDILMVSGLRHRILRIGDLFIQEQNTATGAYECSSQADSALTNGLAFVSMEEVPLITVATGHGEMLDASVRKAFETLMEENAFALREINIMTEEIPENTSILFLPTPTTDYTEEEIARLRAFLSDETEEQSRTLLFSAYPGQGKLPKLKNFLKEWGVSVEEGTVFETDDSRMFLTSPNTVFVKSGGKILADGAYPYLIAPVASPLRLLFDANDGIYTVPLWVTADTAYIQKEDGKAGQKDTAAQITASYSCKEIHMEEKTVWRNLIVMGSSMALTAPYINSESFGNQSYMRDLMRLASNTKAFTAVTPRRAALNAMDIIADRRTINVVGMGIFTIAIPVCILAAGAAVFQKRRHL